MVGVSVTDDHALRMDQLRLADLVTGRLDGGSLGSLSFSFPGNNAFRGDFTGESFSFDLSTGTVKEIRVVYNHVGTTFITNLDQPLTDFVRWGATSDETDLRATIFSGNDNISGASFDDYLSAYAGNDALNGGSGSDTLEGGDGNDTLDGGAGDDQMSGGVGNDVYLVDSSADLVAESANSGTDTVIASLNYTLGTDVENLTLASGSQASTGTGNALDNIITGNDMPDNLIGGDGSDTLIGGQGNDHLYGQSANGGTDGADSLSGGAGSDYLQGNAGNDTLDGGDGSDRINGGANDDLITGAGDNDTVNGNLGNDTIDGGDGNDSLRGGQGNDSITGGNGNDIISGDLGVDTLTGGAGADIFQFSGQASPAAAPDVITDFTHGTDLLSIGYIPAAILTGAAQSSLSAAATFAQQQFDGHAGNHEVAAVTVGSDTYLFFSSNGGPAADSAILLQGMSLTILSVADFT